MVTKGLIYLSPRYQPPVKNPLISYLATVTQRQLTVLSTLTVELRCNRLSCIEPLLYNKHTPNTSSSTVYACHPSPYKWSQNSPESWWPFAWASKGHFSETPRNVLHFELITKTCSSSGCVADLISFNGANIFYCNAFATDRCRRHYVLG